MKNKIDGKWIVLIGIIFTSLTLRSALTSLTDIYSYVEKDVHNFNASVMGVLPLFSFSFFGLLAPRIQKKIGYERALFVAMIMVSVGIFLRCFTSDFLFFSISSVIAFAGMAFGNVLLPPIFKKYFPDHIGIVTSFYSVLVAISAGLPSIISGDITSVYGWKVSLIIWAFVGIVAAIPWIAQIILNSKEVSVAKDVHLIDHIKTMKWKKSWMLAFLFGLGGMLPMYTVINWLPTYLTANGFTSETAGTILFLYNTLGIIHSFLVPIILPKLKKPYILIVLAVLFQIIGYVGFLYDVSGAWIWAVIAAPGLLTVPVTFQLFNMHSKTPNGAAHLSSFVQCIGYLLAVIGPLRFSLLHQVANNYIVPFWFLIMTSASVLYFGKEALEKGFIEDSNK